MKKGVIFAKMGGKQKLRNIIFISDLHLGVGRANDFHAGYHLHRLLDYAVDNADELVILGDFLELLQCDFLEIYAEHRLIFEHLFELARKIPVKYVLGNHDAAIAIECDPRGCSNFFGSKIEVIPEYENEKLKLFAIHGHQYSLENCHKNLLDPNEMPTGDRITQIVGWLEKNVNHSSDTFLEKIYLGYKKIARRISGDTQKLAELVNPSHPDYRKLGGNFSEYERGAEDILASECYSLAVFGHTHVAGVREFENGIYANCGSWVGEDPICTPPTFLEVNEKFVRLVDAQTLE